MGGRWDAAVVLKLSLTEGTWRCSTNPANHPRRADGMPLQNFLARPAGCTLYRFFTTYVLRFTQMRASFARAKQSHRSTHGSCTNLQAYSSAVPLFLEEDDDCRDADVWTPPGLD